MQGQAMTPAGVEDQEVPKVDRAAWRAHGRDVALRNGLRKRSAGVPSYTVPEAAALLSVSAEHMYRLVRVDAFPAVRMSTAGEQGRYVVPASAVDRLLDMAAEVGGCTDSVAWTADWHTGALASKPHAGGGAV